MILVNEPKKHADVSSHGYDEPMTRAETSATSRIGQWASRQLADYDARNPGTVFDEGVVLNVAEGYELQSAVAELRLRRRPDRSRV